MPNLASLYTAITKNPESLIPEPAPELQDAGRQQLLTNWHQSTITQEKILKHENDIAKLFNECVDLAGAYPSHQNPHGILQRLNKIAILREIIREYGN